MVIALNNRAAVVVRPCVAEALDIIREFYPGAYFDLELPLGEPPTLVAYWKPYGQEVKIGVVK